MSSEVIDFIKTERETLTSCLDDADSWLGAFGNSGIVDDENEKMGTGTGGGAAVGPRFVPRSSKSIGSGTEGETDQGAQTTGTKLRARQERTDSIEVEGGSSGPGITPHLLPVSTSSLPADDAHDASSSYSDNVDKAKMKLKGSIEAFSARVNELRESVEIDGAVLGNEAQQQQQQQYEKQHDQETTYSRSSPLEKRYPQHNFYSNNDNSEVHASPSSNYGAAYRSGFDSPLYRSSSSPYNRSGRNHASAVEMINGETVKLMDKVKREVDIERLNVEESMKRFAIRETEQKLHEMRRGHVEELEQVLGETITTVGGSLVTQDQKQIQQLKTAVEKKRDEMLVQSRDSIYAQLEIAVRTLEREHRHRIHVLKEEVELMARAEMQKRLEAKERAYRLEMASSELEAVIDGRISEIVDDNKKESERVFGELAAALEVGSAKNLEQLVDDLNNKRKEKEDRLVAHSEKVVGEAMESLAAELLESERQELNDIRIKSENERIEMINKTRTEGAEALYSAVESEKNRIRSRRDLKVQELRSRLQRKTQEDLAELEEALNADLKTAENLMVDSVRGGLASTLQSAINEHNDRAVVDEKMLESLTRKLRKRQLEVVKELPNMVNKYRLRAVGEADQRSGSAEFETNKRDIEDISDKVSSGRTALALNVLSEKFQLLETRNEEAAKELAEISNSTKALRRELRGVDKHAHNKFYNKGTFKTGSKSLDDSTTAVHRADAINNILDEMFKSMAESFISLDSGDSRNGLGGESATVCKKCARLYQVNGELLKEINGDQPASQHVDK